MKQRIQDFVRHEDGAVTVDWVVLTASVVGLAIAGITATKQGVGAASSTISTDLGAITTGTP